MNIFETLRDLVSVEQVTGGRVGEKIFCLAHHDVNTPNLHLYDYYGRCFACGFHGDVVALWQRMHGFDRPIEAALDLAREFGVEVPERDPGAERKAEERREKEALYLEQAQACHRTLTRHPGVVAWWDGRGFGEELRARFLLGANRNGTAAVIPFWHRGRVHGLIRRPLDGEPGKYLYPEKEEFAAGYRPLFIPGAPRGDAFLVEGIVDALALVALEESAIAVGGTGISERQMRELKRVPGSLYVLPDADEEGEKAAIEWVRMLYPKALWCPPGYDEEGVVEHA